MGVPTPAAASPATTNPNPGPSATLPPAVIRPFVPETDLKIVRYLVGASIMEP